MELQCDICFNLFDLDHHRPKSLICGHTICQECVQNPGLGGKCPTCRKDLNADPAALPDTIALIRLIEHDGAPPLKKPRTEETEVRQLRRGVEAGRKVVEVLRLVVPRAVE
ncbi:E3 ubiquitin-protein ligase RNF182-like [Frankliniella occidentalis]|uniref:E3 ubiquitin-protein ligase RNF182-like n=1 Tax=Frankliniella occidentalis TaxID=133901 RepID=A0A9C6UF73_FRAOC|nr:E3 ubiquitin-protein ligase RNF182-like [Frankliniella occidentalis]XP_052126704.1 E3 ubiquitin-protein ligase RNF182-like [Frankliniella occidentalis]